MQTARQIQEDLQCLCDEALAIQNLADRDQGGVLDQHQQARWDELMARDEEGQGGLVQQTECKMESRRKVEVEKSALDTTRKSLAQGNSPFDQMLEHRPRVGPKVVNRGGRLKAFKGENAELDAYDSGMWFRAMFGRHLNRRDEKAEQRISARGWDVQAQHVEGTDTLGGFLVPDPLEAAIINYREQSGVARALCDVRTMSSDTLRVSKKVGTTTVYYPGEATAITASEQTFAQVSLTAIKRAILSQVSQELQDDAIINVVDDLAREMGSDFSLEEDDAFINGDGTTHGGVSGLIDAVGTAGEYAATAGVVTWAALVIEDFTTAMALLPTKFRSAGAQWLCSPQFYDSVMTKLMAENGVNTIAQFEQGGLGAGNPLGPGGRFLGYPVYFTDHMPAEAVSAKFAFFGAFDRAALLGTRLGVRIAFSDQFAFDLDVISVRGTSRYDLVVHEPGDDSGNVGAYVSMELPAV